MNNICIVGGGFVGLTSAAYFSDNGLSTLVVDSDQLKIDKILDTNKAPFFEPGLDEIIQKNINKTLFFSSDLESAISSSEIIYVCVGTPVSELGKIDLTYIESATADIGKCLFENNEKKIIVIKSTVVPGTTNGIVKNNLELFSKKKCGEDFFLAMNPEFLREGSAVWDTYNPDRIIIGADELTVSKKLSGLFSGSDTQKTFFTNIETAEISKYCSNSFFALLISFSNEIAKLCEILPNVDSRDVFETLYNDRRVSVETEDHSLKPELISYLLPGIGYGGSCFPKDILALENFAKDQGLELPILRGISQTNQNQTSHQVDRFLETYPLSKVGLLGLSFKPDTDDIRFSKSLEIIDILLKNNIEIYAYDPKVKELENYNEVKLCDTSYRVIEEVDGIIIATAWEEFKEPSFIDSILERKLPVLDARLIFPKNSSKNLPLMGPGLSS